MERAIYFRLYPGSENEPTRRRRGLFVCEGLRRLGWRVDHNEGSDAKIVVLQRLYNPALIREYQSRGAIVVVETNDNLLFRGSPFHVPTENESLRIADFVVVSCRWMRRQYAWLNPNTLIAPEALENELWTTKQPELPEEPLVLSWIGMPDNLQYIEWLIDTLAEIKGLQLRIITSERDSRKNSNRDRVTEWPVPTQFIVWNLENFAQEMVQAHAGFVPLPDTAFCRAKGQHKVLSFACAGLPCIASNLPSYREVIKHGESGLLAETPEEWIEGIERLRDPTFRRQLGEAGHAISQHFTREAVAAKWSELLTLIARHRDD